MICDVSCPAATRRTCSQGNCLLAQLSMKAFNFLSPLYTVVFVLVRSVIAPPAVTWLIWRLHETPGLPAPARCSRYDVPAHACRSQIQPVSVCVALGCRGAVRKLSCTLPQVYLGDDRLSRDSRQPDLDLQAHTGTTQAQCAEVA